MFWLNQGQTDKSEGIGQIQQRPNEPMGEFSLLWFKTEQFCFQDSSQGLTKVLMCKITEIYKVDVPLRPIQPDLLYPPFN